MYENVNRSDVHQTLGLDRTVLLKSNKEKHDQTKHSLLEQSYQHKKHVLLDGKQDSILISYFSLQVIKTTELYTFIIFFFFFHSPYKVPIDRKYTCFIHHEEM